MIHLHTFIDHERGGEGHNVRDRHVWYKLGKVDEKLWCDTWKLVNESSCHGFHGLLFFWRDL